MSLHWTPTYPSCPSLSIPRTSIHEINQFIKELDDHLLNNNGLVQFESIINYIFSHDEVGYYVVPHYILMKTTTPIPLINFVRSICKYAPFEILPQHIFNTITKTTIDLIESHEPQDTLDDQDKYLYELYKILDECILVNKDCSSLIESHATTLFKSLYSNSPIVFKELRTVLHIVLSRLPRCNEIVTDLIDNCFQSNKDAIIQCFKETTSLYHGLENCGATCYINSVLQQLFMLPTFQNYITSTQTQNHTHHVLKTLYERLQTTTTFAVCRDILPNILGESSPIELNIQDDSFLFVTNLLDSLSNDNSPEVQKMKQEFSLETTVCLKCQECENQRIRTEVNSSLSVDSTNKSSLNDAINELQQPETLFDIECPECKKKTQHIRSSTFTTIPQVLIVGINRNKQVGNGHNFKYNKEFTFPEHLEFENKSMSLCGVVLHSGTVDTGHYTSLVKTSTGEWIKFNDKIVVPYNYKRLQDDSFGSVSTSLSASILFYKNNTTNNGNNNIPIEVESKSNISVLFDDPNVWESILNTKNITQLLPHMELLLCCADLTKCTNLEKLVDIVSTAKGSGFIEVMKKCIKWLQDDKTIGTWLLSSLLSIYNDPKTTDAISASVVFDTIHNVFGSIPGDQKIISLLQNQLLINPNNEIVYLNILSVINCIIDWCIDEHITFIEGIISFSQFTPTSKTNFSKCIPSIKHLLLSYFKQLNCDGITVAYIKLLSLLQETKQQELIGELLTIVQQHISESFRDEINTTYTTHIQTTPKLKQYYELFTTQHE
ncbi:USP domain-containing protein [Entamoeba marina]